MRWVLAAAAFANLPAGASARPILHDPVALNIGINCQWQSRCMAEQRRAMKQSLAYVADNRPARWRVQLCNRNAGRSNYRVDWVGFDHCIRNVALRPTAAALKRTKR